METFEALKEILDVEEETDKDLVDLANKEKAIIVCLIAPYVPLRVSPIEEKAAHIGLSEEFGVETIITEIKKKTEGKIRKLYLLLNSPGGLITSSYKVAKAIRDNFKDITVFIPHVAASGGTLVALTGNKIVMGMMSNLTPLDIVIRYKMEFVSIMTLFRSFERVSRFFEKRRPDEVPYPWKAMADKYDPIIMEEWTGLLDTSILYIKEILEKSGYENAEEMAKVLIMGFKSHSQVITYNKAKEIGLKVENASDYPEIWSSMRRCLGRYVLQSADKHFIRYVIPKLEE